MSKVGERIGAIYKASEETVYVLGFGVYVGDEIPPKDGGWMAAACHEVGATNPKLVLDDGQIVWGCQCWWGPADRALAMIGNRKIEYVRMEDILRATTEENE